MIAAFSDITILIVGDALHVHAVSRISREFKVVRLEKADADLVTPELANSVRGLTGAMIGIDAAFIDALPNLEIIGYYGMGYDTVDARHAASRGVMVTNTPDVMNEEVADVALGLLIMAARELSRAEDWLRAGRWVGEGAYPLTSASLRGRRAGIFGLGRIGLAIARRLEAFGIEIAYHNRSPKPSLPYTYHPTLLGMAADVDTLICTAPGGPSTDKALGQAVLEALGPDGIVINVGRGSVIDEAALAAALADGTIRAAGLDVFADEPNVPQALIELPNAVLLPHVASASQRTRRAVADLCVDNLVAWFSEGKPLTPVQEMADFARRQEPRRPA